MVRPAIFVLGLLIAAGLSPLSAQGRFGIDDCPSVAEGQFKYVPLVARSVSTQTKALGGTLAPGSVGLGLLRPGSAPTGPQCCAEHRCPRPVAAQVG